MDGELDSRFSARDLEEKSKDMPMVGKKKFAYTAKGKAEAKEYAAKSGKKVDDKEKGKGKFVPFKKGKKK